MKELIKIGNQQITVKEYKGQRVVTFKDIDTVHERPEGTARRNFNTNKKRLFLGKDYFERNSYEAKEEYGITAPNGLVLMTERGYLMLVKSFTDDLAWEVQGQLVDTYFNKPRKPLTALEQLNLHNQAIIEVNEKVEDVKQELEEFKKDLPVLALDLSRIKNARNQKIVNLLGGKQSNAYKDNKLRGKVYSDNARQVWRQYGINNFNELRRSQVDDAINIINNYELPMILCEEIRDTNAQMTIA